MPNTCTVVPLLRDLLQTHTKIVSQRRLDVIEVGGVMGVTIFILLCV